MAHANVKKGGRVVGLVMLESGIITGKVAPELKCWLDDEDATVWLPSAGGPVARGKKPTAEWRGHRLMGRPAWATWDDVEFVKWEPKPWPKLPKGTVA